MIEINRETGEIRRDEITREDLRALWAELIAAAALRNEEIAEKLGVTVSCK